MTRLQALRNIGIMAHIDAGKTTLSERILYYAGRIRNYGEVHEGNTVLDSTALERQKGITISAAATHALWQYPTQQGEAIEGVTEQYRINIIDTPGHIDFTAEVARSLRVLDGAVFVLSAVEGVQPQSETVWRQADKHKVPRIAFVNKMDRPGSDFLAVVRQLKDKLGAVAIPLQLPIGDEEFFIGVVDLVLEKAFVWSEEDKGKTWQEVPVPASLQEDMQHWRHELLEAVAGYDDQLLEQYLLDAGTIAPEDIQRAIRKATIDRHLIPVLCGSAFKNKGVQTLLDAVVAYLPSPLDLPPVKGINPETGIEEERKADATQPLAALAFKLVSDSYVGKLTFLRIYSGTLDASSYVVNMRTGKKERIARLLQMHANQQQAVEKAEAGDIVAVVGLRDVRTGDTLAAEAFPVVLEQMSFPEPVIGYAIEAKRSVDSDKLGNALARLLEEDPTLHLYTVPETGQTVLRGMGELHLEVAVSRLATDFGVDVNQGQPQVAYKEAFTRRITHRKLYKRQNGGSGSFAEIVFEIGPGEAGKTGLVFVNAISGGTIPKEFIPAVQKGLEAAMQNGPLGGYPVESMQVTLLDGKFHREDSDAQSFEMAAILGFREAAKEAGPELLEPIMAVEVLTPDGYTGAVIGDLNRRRGLVKGMDSKANVQQIQATVPLVHLFGYVTTLRTLTSGRAEASLQFDHYAVVPSGLAREILAGVKVARVSQYRLAK
jgi:elongation factor G